ncbi:hypothetical protein D0962_36795 [Leptolyngbyaceae cyanobacterium CCMR0082]|uniref:Uncharacterized protein n=1 Tax=Adonisia turfae CCMR0082 TaxID=2304604 RepID=A0A6M0SIU2_9CYAN|nr:hypothetical protein [Adonisia turfae CCMR0082]
MSVVRRKQAFSDWSQLATSSEAASKRINEVGESKASALKSFTKRRLVALSGNGVLSALLILARFPTCAGTSGSAT